MNAEHLHDTAPNLFNDIVEQMGLEAKPLDEQLRRVSLLTTTQAMDKFLSYNGIINFTMPIINAWTALNSTPP